MGAVPEKNLLFRLRSWDGLGIVSLPCLLLSGPCLGPDVTLAEILQFSQLPLGQDFTLNVGTVTLLPSDCTCCSAVGRVCVGRWARAGDSWPEREKLRGETQTGGVRGSGAAENGEGRFL